MVMPRSVPELRSLDLLVSVGHLGSLGRAAMEHGIGQPAASLRMQQLERRLGVSLLDRGPTGSRLTADGAMVVEWAQTVLDSMTAFDAGVGALRGSRTTKVRVAASMTIAEYLVPSWLVLLRERRPGLAVALSVGNSHDVADWLRSDQAQIGFVEGPSVPLGLSFRVIGHDRLALVVGPGHPWARRRKGVTAQELARTELVQREIGSGTRETLERALEAVGRLSDPLVELSSTKAIKSAVAAGVGPAVLSTLAVADDLAARRLVEVPVIDLDLSRSLRVVWPKGRQLIGPVRDLRAVAGRGARHVLS